MNKHEEKKKGVYKNFLTGGMSAALARCISNPFERIEILRQVGNVDYKGLNFFQTIKKIYVSQGIKGFYVGAGTLVAWAVPFSAIEFYSVELYRNILIRGNNNHNTLFYNIICGGLAGFSANLFTFPLDVVRTRISVNTKNSILKETTIRGSLYYLWSKEGFNGIYRGFGVASIGAITYVGIKQTLFDVLKQKYTIDRYRRYLHLIFGAISGIVGQVILYPLFAYRRVRQVNCADKQINLFSYLKEAYQRKGIQGLYIGMSMTLVKTGLYNGLTFLFNETLKELFKY